LDRAERAVLQRCGRSCRKVAPEWNGALEAHLAWWNRIVATHREKGTQASITPEFGPFPYLPAAPTTLKPFVEQWALNLQMLELFKTRYS
jgi:hypothetical protein